MKASIHHRLPTGLQRSSVQPRSLRGQMTIGAIKPVPYGALGSVGRKVFVALVRRNDESVFELFTRLDAASGRVADQHFVIDEVSAHIKRSRTDSEPRDDE